MCAGGDVRGGDVSMRRLNFIALLLMLPCFAGAAAAAPQPRATQSSPAPTATPTRRTPTTIHVGQRVNRQVQLAPGGRYAISFSVDETPVGGFAVTQRTRWRLIDLATGRDVATRD